MNDILDRLDDAMTDYEDSFGAWRQVRLNEVPTVDVRLGSMRYTKGGGSTWVRARVHTGQEEEEITVVSQGIVRVPELLGVVRQDIEELQRLSVEQSLAGARQEAERRARVVAAVLRSRQ